MIEINKKTLALVLVVSLLFGAVGAILAMKTGFGDSVNVSREEYNELREYKEDYRKLDDIKNFILENYYEEVDEDTLLEGAYYGLVDSLNDPYSEYISSLDADAYMEELMGTGTYGGVGITFLSEPYENGFYISSVNSKGPAYASGVRKGDIIAKVDGANALDYSSDELRDRMRGDEGTQVVIGLYRGSEYYEVNLTRQDIPAESVAYEMLDGGIGYIQIMSFISDTSGDFEAALSDIESRGASGLIIDLRDNGGGLVVQAVEIADLLMDKGVVVSAVDHDGQSSSYKTSDGRTDLPYVLLVNQYTASSSEILAAGVKDNGEGTIIGTQTFGKGIIQNFEMYPDGSMVKYTELQYLSPNGEKIHNIGITPDIEVELTDDCYNEQGFLVKDAQLERAIEYLKEGR